MVRCCTGISTSKLSRRTHITLDAVPKKRGPKTDVLEALLKRVDGLEKRLKTEEKDASTAIPSRENADASNNSNDAVTSDGRPPKVQIPTSIDSINAQSTIISPVESFGQPTPTLYPQLLLDIYFSRLHGKPFHILDEVTTRQRLQNNQLPTFLAFAIYALSARYASQFDGYSNAVRVGHDYYRRARMELDVDEPSIESLQTLLLLTQVAFQQGKGKKAYMHLSKCCSLKPVYRKINRSRSRFESTVAFSELHIVTMTNPTQRPRSAWPSRSTCIAN